MNALSHLEVLPILIPLVAGVVCIMAGGRLRPLHRIVSIASALLLLGIAVMLAMRTGAGEYLIYRPGAWPAPYGIVLVADRLSSLMLVVTDIVAVAALIYASSGTDAKGRHFHSCFQLQLVGLHGAFLTGDMFNLFVFFEILLIASYCLLLFGGGERRTKAALHYVVLNLAGSALFLVGVGILYGVTGALNMADLSVRVALLPPGDAALVRGAGLLLLVVFGLKAAVMPLYFWLPNAYAAATAPVAAFFAIMTKVGVYCIVRVFTLIFGPFAGPAADTIVVWLLPIALVTQIFAFAGALAARDLRRMVGYLLVASVGTMLAGIGLFTRDGLSAGLYYLIHSTLTMAALFLIADLLARQRGTDATRLTSGARLLESGPIGTLYFIGAIAAVGLPPLAGFLGKAQILAAAPSAATGWWLWAITLSGSVIALLAVTRAGIVIFWHTSGDPVLAAPRSGGRMLPVIGLCAALLALAVFAGPVSSYTTAAAEQLLQPGGYVSSVLEAR